MKFLTVNDGNLCEGVSLLVTTSLQSVTCFLVGPRELGMRRFITMEAQGPNQRSRLPLILQFQICLFDQGQQRNDGNEVCIGCVCWNLKVFGARLLTTCEPWRKSKLCNVLRQLSSSIFLLCPLKESQIVLRCIWGGFLLIKGDFPLANMHGACVPITFLSVPAFTQKFINMWICSDWSQTAFHSGAVLI